MAQGRVWRTSGVKEGVALLVQGRRERGEERAMASEARKAMVE